MSDEKPTENNDLNMIEIGGNRYELKLSVSLMRKLRRLDPPIDITKLVDDKDPDGGLWARMKEDPCIVATLVYNAIQGQENAPSDPDEFANLIGGDEIDALTKASLDAIISFSPRSKREAMTKIVKEVDSIEGQMLKEAIEDIDSGKTGEVIKEAMEGKGSASTSESSKSKDKSGSTQGTTRSEI